MHLAEALGVVSINELDPTRVLRLGQFELGIEATAEAVRILSGEDFPREVTWLARKLSEPIYWSIAHRTEGEAELFGFPPGSTDRLPTAIEVALVRAIAAATPGDHAEILEGGAVIALGPILACRDFLYITEIVGRPLVGTSLLFGGATQAIIDENIATRLNKVVLSCLANSFQTSPLKFRFLELYRMMEACFLADIKSKLLASFDAEPSASLKEATAALKSEVLQITGLAETQQDAFQACWTELDQMKNTNRFVAALFRRVASTDRGGCKWQTGAALIYQIRCAVVHAGEKDIILESFPDGEKAIEIVLPHIERAALLLVGIELGYS